MRLDRLEATRAWRLEPEPDPRSDQSARSFPANASASSAEWNSKWTIAWFSSSAGRKMV